MADDDKKTISGADGGGIMLSPKTLVYSGMLALGGVLGGGGVSVASSPAADVQELHDDVKEMKNAVDRMTIAVAGLTGSIGKNEEDIEDLEDEIKELEERVRHLELGD